MGRPGCSHVACRKIAEGVPLADVILDARSATFALGGYEEMVRRACERFRLKVRDDAAKARQLLAQPKVPEGWKALTAYSNGKLIVVEGLPAPESDHNCDAMGCGQCHLVAAFAIPEDVRAAVAHEVGRGLVAKEAPRG